MRIRNASSRNQTSSLLGKRIVISLASFSVIASPAQAISQVLLADPTECTMNNYDYNTSLFDLKFAQQNTLQIPQNAQVGDVLATYIAWVPDYPRQRSSVPLGYCPPGTAENFLMAYGSEVPGMPGVYETSVAGIGYTVTYPGRTDAGPQVFLNPWTSGLLYWPANTQSKLTLVKTGTITGGIISSGLYAHVKVSGTGIALNANVPPLLRLSLASPISISLPTCSFIVADRARNIQLPPVNLDHFRDVGSRLKAQDFSLTVNCVGGAAEPFLSFTPTSGVDGSAPGVLSLSSDSTAGGVGVFMNFRASAGDPYVPADFTGTPVRAGISQGISGGAYVWRIELQTGYQQTAATITEGTVKAMATIAVTYN